MKNTFGTLEMITKKPIHGCTSKVTENASPTAKYDYTLIYKPGKEMTLADRLSRFPSNKENTPIELHQNIQHLTLYIQ